MICRWLLTKKCFKASPVIKNEHSQYNKTVKCSRWLDWGKEVDKSEEQNKVQGEGDRFEIYDVGDGGNKDTCGQAGIMVPFKKVDHSWRCRK